MTKLQIAAGVLLLFNSGMDIYKKRISINSILIYLIAGIFLWVKSGPVISFEGVILEYVTPVVIGLFPGFLFCITSILSRGRIGFGDGILVAAVGAVLGSHITVVMIMWAFFLSFIWSLVGLSLKKVRKNTEFPFVPFLLLGYLAAVCGQAGDVL